MYHWRALFLFAISINKKRQLQMKLPHKKCNSQLPKPYVSRPKRQSTFSLCFGPLGRCKRLPVTAVFQPVSHQGPLTVVYPLLLQRSRTQKRNSRPLTPQQESGNFKPSIDRIPVRGRKTIFHRKYTPQRGECQLLLRILLQALLNITLQLLLCQIWHQKASPRWAELGQTICRTQQL